MTQPPVGLQRDLVQPLHPGVVVQRREPRADQLALHDQPGNRQRQHPRMRLYGQGQDHPDQRSRAGQRDLDRKIIGELAPGRAHRGQDAGQQKGVDDAVHDHAEHDGGDLFRGQGRSRSGETAAHGYSQARGDQDLPGIEGRLDQRAAAGRLSHHDGQGQGPQGQPAAARGGRGSRRSASSMLKASDSPSRYTTTGHIQLPRTRAPIAAAMIHWRSSTRSRPGCRHIATSKVRTPPATEAATTAPVARGILIADRARVSSMPSCSRPSRSRPTRSRPSRPSRNRSRPCRSSPRRSRPRRPSLRHSRPGRSRSSRSSRRRSTPGRPTSSYRTAPASRTSPTTGSGSTCRPGRWVTAETVVPGRVGSSRAADWLRFIGPAVAAA